jgi:hypothetical protein
MGANSRRRAAGFTLPLTMALAFSLMTLATAIVGMVVVSDRQAKQSALELVTRTTLESAIEQGLFGLERDGEPETNEWTDREALNGLDVTLTFWPAHYKPDLNQSSTDAIGAALADPALRQRAVAAFVPPTPRDRRPQFKRFIDFVQALGVDAADEDCLRRRLTIGRQSGVTDPAPPASALTPPRDPLGPGELIDVRAETFDAAGRRTALWRRVRYTGKPERLWLTHDWRELRLPRADIDCPLATPAPQITPDLNLGGASIKP